VNYIIIDNNYKFNPWNKKNIKIPNNVVNSILNKHGIQPVNYDIYQQACIHCSYRKRRKDEIPKDRYIEMEEKPDNCMDLWDIDNERIEFVGDAYLAAALSEYLYTRYPEQGEGFLTKLRMKLVNNKSLGTLIKKMGLNKYLIISRHFEEKCDGRNNLKILGGMMEAWIYAVYLDTMKQRKDPWKAVKSFIQSIFERYCDFAQVIVSDYNYKDQLLKHFQKCYGQPPKYKIIDTTGPIHERIFTMGVLSVDEKVISSASARCKKTAEQMASKAALKKLGVTTVE
jgi:ribonuclease-3